MATHRLLSASEEKELARRIQARGPDWIEARNTLILHNVRLAIDVARQFQGRGVEYEDLVQAILFGTPTADNAVAGGLARAAELYDGRGRFSTYAVGWARQAAQKAVHAQHSTIRVPGEIHKLRLTISNEPDLTDEQVAARHKCSVARVHIAREAAHVAASTDALRADADGNEYGSNLPDPNADDPADVVDDDNSGWIRARVEALPAEERRVIEMHYGLNGYGGREHSLRQIAAMIGLDERAVKGLHSSALVQLGA
jgi:RNA polymerase sigma factor (sigma-70 family)